ncbi:MAG: NUDIX domain-containing protein [Clostridia bacterium]|nr:NUDIX domain-containing protein [Clostridia bacterium]
MRSPYHPDAVDEPPATVDLRPMTALYLTRGEEILLLYRTGSRVVGNSYTGAAGGHMEADEYNSARACVLRELREETGLTPDDLTDLAMRYVTLRLKDGEIRQNYYFFAGLRPGCQPGESNEGRLEWHHLDALAALPMPHTAKQVLMHYVAEGRFTQLLYGGVSAADGTVFTPMTEF